MTRPFIIAEVAQGYEGDIKLVDFYVRVACYAKADAVKFQIFSADELALSDYKYYPLFKSLQVNYAVWQKAVDQAHKKGLEFYSDIFGQDSFEQLDKIGVDGFKIHSTDINNISLLKLAAMTKKKLFLSTGGCLQVEIAKALDILKNCRVTLMYGFQAEPTEIKDNNLNRIKTLKTLFQKPVGFQDHTQGDSPLAFYPAFVAMGLGANVFEKHLTLVRAAQIEDHISAVEPEEFRLWADAIKRTHPILGMEKWNLTDKENEYRKKVKRAVCSSKHIRKGTLITEKDVVLKRTGNKKAVYEMSEIIGKKALKNIEANSVVEAGFVG